MPDRIAALRTKFATAVADKKVTSNEAKALVATLSKDAKPAELAALRELYLANQSKFEPAAAARIQKLIGSAPAPQPPPPPVTPTPTPVTPARKDLADPAVLDKHAASLKWDWLPGTLMVDGVKETDVVQGQIGNCYMVSAFAAVAKQSPDVIKNAFTDNGDGTYTVHLFKVGASGTKVPNDVVIDGQLPQSYGSLSYAKGADRSELWVPLLEKAFAQSKGGYEAIGKGGLAGDVMQALTGRPYSYTGMSAGMSTDAVYEKLKTGLAAGKSAAAGTHGEEDAALYSGTGLHAWHSYSVLGVSEENGTKMVTLRNPWGRSEPGNDGKDDGIFKLDMASFAKFYTGVFID
jgi:hypothetical protein